MPTRNRTARSPRRHERVERRMRISAIGWPNGGDLAALDTIGAM